MMNETDEQQLVTFLADMREDEALALAKQMIAGGHDPLRVLECCRDAMDIVGARYEAQEYFLPELMLAGEMLSEVSALVKPLIVTEGDGAKLSKGTVVIGTVHGDLHDIGKNIVSFMLEISGFTVIDLGVDVRPETFIDAIRDHNPEIVGLSGFLTLAFDSMKETIDAFSEAGLRDKFRIMIGGGQMDERVREFTGADAFGKDAIEAVSLCNNWAGA